LKALRNPNLLLGLALTIVAFLIIATRSLDGLSNEGASRDPRYPGASAEASLSDGTDPKDGIMHRPGKRRIRPTPAEIARMRLEKARDEIAAKLAEMEVSGLGKRHPAVLESSRILAAIEAELIAGPGTLRESAVDSLQTEERKGLEVKRDEVASKLAELEGLGLGRRHPSILSNARLLADIEAKLESRPGYDR
jgi:hypothetical protein